MTTLSHYDAALREFHATFAAVDAGPPMPQAPTACHGCKETLDGTVQCCQPEIDGLPYDHPSLHQLGDDEE